MTAALASAANDLLALAAIVVICGALPYGAFRAACWLIDGEDE